MTFKAGVSGNPAGPKLRTLSATELETVRTLTSRGVRPADLHRAIFASRSLFDELKERQPELTEAVEAGIQKFHDSLLAGVTRIAVDVDVDARTRLDALKYLLCSRFNYRD